jgi:hypothetical protein
MYEIYKYFPPIKKFINFIMLRHYITNKDYRDFTTRNQHVMADAVYYAGYSIITT